MVRFVLVKYSRTIIGTSIGIASIELLATGLQHSGAANAFGQWLVDSLPIWGIAPFFILPLMVTAHAASSPGEHAQPVTHIRAWYMGMIVNLCIGLPVSVVGIVAASYAPAVYGQPGVDSLYIALGTILGFVGLLWVGAVMGWGGFLLSKLLGKTARG